VNIEHAQDLAKAFRQHGIAAEASWGTDPERAAKLARHKSGETLVLTNCAILLEGYNDPSIACIILARPTKSSLLFTQAIGRGTRLFEGKANCLIIDVADSTKRHSLALLASLLGLPKTLNLRGQSAIAALKIVEDAAREYPHVDLSGLRDIAKLQEYIEQVNFWDTKFPEEVEQFSEFVWHRSLGGFVLSMPNREKLEIKQNLLGTFDITGVLNGRSIGFVADSLEQAFHKCDALVVAKVSQHLPVLTRKAKWHDAPATPAQILTLSKLLRGTGRVIPENLSKGEASRVIGQQIAAFKPRPARPAWLEAKINSRKGKVA
jgi:hypothetical protein